MANNPRTIFSGISRRRIIEGSPESVKGKALYDGAIENYGDYATETRKQINYHHLNGTDVSANENAMVSGVVGATINIQCKTDNPEINNAFEELLERHGQKKNFEVTNRWHRNGGFRRMIASKFTEGGFLMREHFNSRWSIPYRIEIVGVDMIDVSKTSTIDRLYNGIQKDRYGRITGIYLFVDDKKIQSELFSTRNMEYEFSPWIDISQYTAVSRLVTLLPTLDGISEYLRAEILAALERAKSGVYWHTELYSVLQKALKETLDGVGVDEAISEVKEVMNDLAARGVGYAGATPIPEKDTITQIDNKTDSVLNSILDQSQKGMAAAVGGSQVSVYKDIEKGNYSSIKAAISFDDETYGIWFDDFENSSVRRYLETLFRVGVQMGVIPVSREEYFADPEKYHKFEILRNSKRVIDEVKNANAIDTNLENGSTTINRVYADKNLDYVEEKRKEAIAKVEARKIFIENNLPLPPDLQPPENANREIQTEENTNEN